VSGVPGEQDAAAQPTRHRVGERDDATNAELGGGREHAGYWEPRQMQPAECLPTSLVGGQMGCAVSDRLGDS
jgi:hypothetical protein